MAVDAGWPGGLSRGPNVLQLSCGMSLGIQYILKCCSQV